MIRVTAKTRKLRRNATDAERLLWARLRNRQLGGFKIRRQVEIGPYIVDFLCPFARVVIEVNGGQHAIDARKDERRSRWLDEQGCQVVRFWNNDVLANPGGALETLLRTLQASLPSPRPSPRGRGEGEKGQRINPLPLAGAGGARRRGRGEGEKGQQINPLPLAGAGGARRRGRGEGEKGQRINPLPLAGAGGARRRGRREGEGAP